MTHVQKETAILLKEKGYNLLGNYFYLSSGKLTWFDRNNWNQDKSEQIYSAPTLHEATDWLREAKGVHVYVTCTSNEWYFSIQNTKGYSLFNSTSPNNTHDLALESGIIHALKNYVK